MDVAWIVLLLALMAFGLFMVVVVTVKTPHNGTAVETNRTCTYTTVRYQCWKAVCQYWAPKR